MTLSHTHEGGKACLACKLETLSEFVERYYRDICVDEARDGLARITAALAEREAGGWTHVDRGLPDSDVSVLVVSHEGDYIKAQLEFTDDSEGHGEPYWSAEGGDLALCNYPHWQPLPAPPSPPATIEGK